ncbi:Oidioi.mRNA.OKI2018_I69.PAR.g9066.t1.cds [Oikopleura dioica]|uniref:Oidioi.mRNA.OKI2018_I69.PAR.g9066.t1.cds n=1 Tax=Oikopleura dioica TaxID=34765 RepID=A0ABN7RLG5_OIKDI|nr:Oidioi.mRNA.OKI2018_I69.PAR.g9066.t1.cds [Oikopleura dioica]
MLSPAKKALLFAAEHFHDKDFGARSQAPKVLVLISDGQDNHPERVLEAAKKLHAQDVSVFVIGIGNESQMNTKMMNQIATEPVTQHIKYANTVEGINKFKNALTGQICEDVKSKQSCDSASMDMAIVFDGSDSVKADNFKKLKTWTGEFIDKLGVQEYGVQVGLVKYATSIIKVSDLSTDIAELKEKLMKVPFIQGKTNTGGALERAQQMLAEGRPSVPKIILLITDGDATDKERLDAQIEILKEANILVYAIGVGDLIDRNELNRIATDEDFVYETRDFDSISKIKSSLLGRVCKKAKPKTSGVCGDISVDLQFIVDSSSSVTRNNYGYAKNFVANVSSVFDLRSGDVQVGVLTYSTNVHTDSAIKLGAIHSQDDFVEKVEAMKYTGGDTHTGQALKFIETNNRWREEVPKILIFVTDGTPQDRAIVPAAAKSLRAKGVRIFAIGVGNAIESELREIASEPYENHVIFIQGADYSAVQRVRGHLERLVSRDPPTYYQTFTTQKPYQPPPKPTTQRAYVPPVRNTPAPYIPEPVKTQTPYVAPVIEEFVDKSSSEEFVGPETESNRFGSYASVNHFSSYRRNGKITSGANLLKTMGFRNSNAVRGSAPGHSAWKFGSSGSSSAGNSFASSLSSVFPGGLSKVFSVVFTFSLQSQDFEAFQVQYNGQDYASFSFQNGDLVVRREGAEDMIRGDLLPNLNDGNFHKIQVFFDELDVTVLVDCLQVGTLDLPTVQTAEQRSDFKLLSSGTGLVQDLAFIAGVAEAEECCELGPNALCPSRMSQADKNAESRRKTGAAKIISTGKTRSCRECCKVENLSEEFLVALKEKLREI